MDDERPSDATIRRALAECLTVSDIDDAMGWRPGTARRRRWRDPPDGLPPADAELGGTALWFRSTVSRWRRQLDQRRDAPRAGSELPPAVPQPESAPPEPAPAASEPTLRPAPAEPPPAPTEPPPAASEPTPRVSHADVRAEPEPGPDAEVEADHASAPGIDDPSTEPGLEVEQDAGTAPPAASVPPAGDDLPAGAEPDGARVRSGFEVEIGEPVFALVHRRWRPATVQARARTTVVVDYRLGGGALDERRQRVAIDRIRRIST